MADFCSQCSVELFLEDFRDLAGLCEAEEWVLVICEGCGPTRVDYTGHCMTDCLTHHYNI